MALTESNIFDTGTSAPSFLLPDTVSDKTLSLSDIKGDSGTVVMFICNHCPYVLYINEALVQLAKDYESNGVGFVAISSNDVINYPQDAPDRMKIHAASVGYPFPYLYDETQEVAKSYKAACTPDVYVFDKDLKSTYHGQLDDARPGNGIPVTGSDIRGVLDCMLAGETSTSMQKPSIGCNIKWK